MERASLRGLLADTIVSRVARDNPLNMSLRFTGPAVRLSRPFTFLIRDIETDTILFIGQVMDPSAR